MSAGLTIVGLLILTGAGIAAYRMMGPEASFVVSLVSAGVVFLVAGIGTMKVEK
jgi:hypothetical protein